MPPIPEPLAFDPSEWRGRNALLLVFAPSPKSPAYEQQIDLVQGAEAGFRARDLVLVQILLEGESYVNDQRMEQSSARRLREQFGVEDESFCVVLLDRDGDERRKTDTPLKAEALFAVLDGSAPDA